MKLSNLAQDRAEVSVAPYDGADGKVWVAYRPAKVTPETQDYIQASMNGNDDPMLEWLVETVIDWDLEEDDGQKVERSVDRLKGMPTLFLIRLVAAMFNGGAVPELKSADSAPS